MSKPRDPFMPFFVGDFFASTAQWPGEAKSLYMHLLAIQWASGPLSPDPKVLAAACGYSVSRFCRLWQIVEKKFKKTDEGLINPKLELVRERSHEISAKHARGGRLTAEKRWGSHTGPDGMPSSSAISSAISSATRSANSSAVASNPIQTKKEKDLRALARPTPTGPGRARKLEKEVEAGIQILIRDGMPSKAIAEVYEKYRVTEADVDAMREAAA